MKVTPVSEKSCPALSAQWLWQVEAEGAGSCGTGSVQGAGQSAAGEWREPPSTRPLMTSLQVEKLAVAGSSLSLGAPLCILSCGTAGASLALSPTFGPGKTHFPELLPVGGVREMGLLGSRGPTGEKVMCWS